VQIGVARGSAVAGGLGAQRRRCHFLGGAAAEAARLARGCPAGETRVQRSVARAEEAAAFRFARGTEAGGARQPAAASGAGAGSGAAMRLCGRRTLMAEFA
jgi:class 3 adenylate cyclase